VLKDYFKEGGSLKNSMFN
jgi:hypothetical protein